MASKVQLLKLSKTELIKKCKKHKVAYTGTKSEMVDRIIKIELDFITKQEKALKKKEIRKQNLKLRKGPLFINGIKVLTGDERALVISYIIRNIENKHAILKIPIGIQQIIYKFYDKIINIKYIPDNLPKRIKSSKPFVMKLVMTGGGAFGSAVGISDILEKYSPFSSSRSGDFDIKNFKIKKQEFTLKIMRHVPDNPQIMPFDLSSRMIHSPRMRMPLHISPRRPASYYRKNQAQQQPQTGFLNSVASTFKAYNPFGQQQQQQQQPPQYQQQQYQQQLPQHVQLPPRQIKKKKKKKKKQQLQPALVVQSIQPPPPPPPAQVVAPSPQKIRFREGNGIFVVFDITDRTTFEAAKKDIGIIDELYAEDGIERCKLLVGNKLDLINKRQVLFDEANKYAKKNGIGYIEVSDKTGANVNDAFEMMIKEIYSKELPLDKL